jgi:hypothetical protein
MVMSPAVMMASASTPSVMMTTPAPTHMAVTVAMAVAASDLDDRCIGAAQSIWCCDGYCRRRQSWRQHKDAGGKSD